MRWFQLKREVELDEGRRALDPVFAGLLRNLLKAGFLDREGDGTYSIPDPMLAHGLARGMVRPPRRGRQGFLHFVI